MLSIDTTEVINSLGLGRNPMVVIFDGVFDNRITFWSFVEIKNISLSCYMFLLKHTYKLDLFNVLSTTTPTTIIIIIIYGPIAPYVVTCLPVCKRRLSFKLIGGTSGEPNTCPLNFHLVPTRAWVLVWAWPKYDYKKWELVNQSSQSLVAAVVLGFLVE